MNSYVVSYFIGEGKKQKHYKRIVLQESELAAREQIYLELTNKDFSDFQITDVKKKGK